MVELNDVIGCCKAENKADLKLRLRRANLSVVSHSIQTALSEFRYSKYPVLEENDHQSKSDHRFPHALNIFDFK